MSSLTDFLASTQNPFAALAEDGISAGDVSGYYDTGSYSLNALISGSIYGGLPDSKSTGIAAQSSVGKTMIALSALYQYQQDHPEGLAIIFESESAISKKQLQERGIDVTRVGVVPVTTVQEFQTQCLRVLDNYEKSPEKGRQKLFLILDSLGMLSTTKELNEAITGSGTKDMTRPSLIRATFRTIVLRLGRARVPLFCTNHTYDSMDQYQPDEIAGGGGFKYACSTILMATKAQDKTADGVIQGTIVTITAYKSRLTKEKMKIKTRIQHAKGLDRYYGLIEFAVECGLLNKVSTKLEWVDTGEKFFESAIIKEPKKHWTKERLDKIEEFAQKKFPYGAQEPEEEAVDG